MTRLSIALCAALAIVAFDTAAAFAARALKFNYAWATLGSIAVYAATGFAVARVASMEWAWGIGAVVGLVDVTLGWRVSWLIGPGRTPDGTLGFSEWLNALGVLIVLSTVCAFAGAWLATRT